MRLAIGGGATFAASVAVVCMVAMSSAAALADSAGAPIGARPVVVPAATPSASATPVPRTAPSAPPAAVPTEPETVLAPDPEDVVSARTPQAPDQDPAPQRPAAQDPESDAPRGGRPEAEDREPRPDRDHVRGTHRSADRDDDDDDDDEDVSDRSGRSESSRGARSDSEAPDRSGTPSGGDLSGSWSGSKRERSPVPPD